MELPTKLKQRKHASQCKCRGVCVLIKCHPSSCHMIQAVQRLGSAPIPHQSTDDCVPARSVAHRRLIKQLHRPKNVAALQTRADHDIPGDGVDLGHCSECPLSPFIVPALGIHIENG